jgi:hypothetical protein
MKIIYLHGVENIDSINTQNIEKGSINPISNRIRLIVDNLLLLCGLGVGLIIYAPMKLKRQV